jgi:iron complex outermembrane receptor protein
MQARLRSAAAPIALSVILAAQPVLAQDEPGTDEVADTEAIPEQAQAATPADGDAIYVTGSRIRRSEFNSPDPITIISPDIAEAQGQLSTAQMLQSSPIAAGSAQVTSAISAVFNTDGGLGAETISLRGLGANRTLVLLNGRRAGPSGTRGSVAAFDLNSLPLSVVRSVEILKTGASSIYGSDAVAGVVNIITSKDTDGFQLDGMVSVPFEGSGQEYRISATWGKDFGNGHILATGDYYKETMLRRRDRDYLDCPEEYIFQGVDTGRTLPNGDPDFDSNGQRADILDPRTGQPRCNDFLWGHVWTYDYDFRQSGLFQYDYDGSLAEFLGDPFVPTDPTLGSTLGVPPGFFRVTDESPRYPLPDAVQQTARGLINAYHPFQAKQSVVPETELYTAYVDAAYDVSSNLELGIELLYNKRKTYYDSYGQFYYLTGYTNDFTPVAPGFGDPFSPGWTGAYFLSPTAITDLNDSWAEVDYYRGVAWADGSFGSFLPEWSYSGYVQYSRSEGEYTDDILYDDAVRWHDYRTGSCAGEEFQSGVECVDINWTTPEFLSGQLTPEEQEFLFGRDTGNTLYEQYIAEASVTGPLFDLPAGSVQTALGVSARWDSIDDLPGMWTLVGNVWPGISSGRTFGKSETFEAFGEIQIPVIRDTPFIQDFTLSGSGRVTNVKAIRGSDGESDSDNGNWTYSVGASWVVNDWLQFRARYGTSFRAPALFELYLADEVGFLSQREIDPCIQLDTNPTVNDRVRANCLAGIPAIGLPGVPGDHPGAGVEASIVRFGGFSRGTESTLAPETSTAKTASVVFTPRIGGGTELNVAVDYFDIEIEGEIAALSAGVLYNCYNSEFFGPDEGFCSLFTRNPDGVAGEFNVDSVNTPFINISRQRNEGIDVTIDISQDVGKFGELQLLAQMNWQLRDELETFPGNSVDNNGEVGEPEWVGDFNLVWRPSDDLSVFYGLDVVGPQNSEQDYIDIFGDVCSDFITYGPICVDLKVPVAFYHSISLTKEFDRFQITGGIANLFDKKPPRITVDAGNNMNGGVVSTIGKSPLSSQYDYYGIRGFVNVRANF